MMMRTERDGGEARRGRRGEEGEGHFLLHPGRSLGRISCSLFPLPSLPLLPPSPLSAVSVGLGSFGPKKLKKQEKTAQERFGPEFRSAAATAAITKRACAPVPLDNNAADSAAPSLVDPRTGQGPFYRDPLTGLGVVARSSFLLFLNCSAWPCMGPS